jgi:hypothetical protein
MKSVKYEGGLSLYGAQSFNQNMLFAPRRKINGHALLFLKWMKEWKEEARDNQSLYKTTVKEDNKFKYVFMGNILTTV